MKRTIGLLAVIACMLTGLIATQQSAGATISRYQTEASFATSVTNLVNAERAGHHLGKLKTNSALQECAANHAYFMAQSNLLSNQLSGEPSPSARIRACGYHLVSWGEIVLKGSGRTAADSAAIHAYVYGHQSNTRSVVLDSRFQDVGVGVVLDINTNTLWLTEVYGRS